MNVRADELIPHDGTALIPPMRANEYRALVEDIKARGIVVPLDVVGNVVLDGRHRLRAAIDLNLPEVPVREINPADPEGYVIKAALLRRHLTDDQRSMLAALWARDHRRPTHDASPRGDAVVGRHARHPARMEAASIFAVTPKRVEIATSLLKQDPAAAGLVQIGKKRMSEVRRELRVVRQQESSEPCTHPNLRCMACGAFVDITNGRAIASPQ